VADKTEQLLETLVEKLIDRGEQSGLSPSQLEAILEKVGLSTAQAMRSSLKPENPDHPHISAFSYPEGDLARPKPELRVKTIFCGMEENADRLTPTEIQAYNAITERRRARNGQWTADLINKGQPNEELHIMIPCETVDQRMGLPPLELILGELNGGPSTADIGGMIATIAKLHAELAAARTAQSLEADFVRP